MANLTASQKESSAATQLRDSSQSIVPEPTPALD